MSFQDWLLKNQKSGTLCILSGFRAAGKTTLVRAALPAVEAAAPTVRTVYLDLESAAYQAMRTADLLWAHVAEQCPKGRFRLVLDEPALFADLVPFLQRVRASGRCASVLLVCSNSWRFEELASCFPVAHFHVAEDNVPALTPEQLDATWYRTLVRDVLCPGRAMDGADVWHLGAWLAEHFGEVTSLRKIAAAMPQYGSRVSHPTVDAYLKAFQHAFLVDRVECRDLFDGAAPRTGFRLAVHNPKLFVRIFAVDKVALARSIAWNDAYLALRLEHEGICYPKCGHADFVTYDSGSPVCWFARGGKPVLRDE